MFGLLNNVGLCQGQQPKEEEPSPHHHPFYDLVPSKAIQTATINEITKCTL